MAGWMPWVVMAQFLPTWLVEAKGMSADIDLSHPNGSAPLIFAIILIGTVVGNVLGGIIGDWADKRSPLYGRTIIGQVSIFAHPVENERIHGVGVVAEPALHGLGVSLPKTSKVILDAGGTSAHVYSKCTEVGTWLRK